MPRILTLTSTFPRWKNDSEPAFVYELNRRLKDHFGITVLTPRTPGSRDSEIMEGLDVIRYPYFLKPLENLTNQQGGILSQLKSNPLNYLLVPFLLCGQIWAIVQLIRWEKIDVIHAHWIIPQGLAAAIALMITRKSLPLVCTSHGGDLYALQGKIFQKFKYWIIKRSQFLTVVSRAMKDMVIDMGIPANKVAVISMGVDLKKKFVPAVHEKKNNRELLFVGRLVEKKGVNILIDAMPRVLAQFPDVELTVIGAGPLEADLHRQCRSLDISDKVVFLGSQPQSKLPEFYQQAAMAVFPFVRAKDGDQEGFGLVVIEAMGCGCPVIASDLPAVKDTVIHGEVGLVVPPGNPDALADTIVFVLQQPEKLEIMAAQALKRVNEKFDWDVVTEKYGRLLRREIEKQIL